TEGGPRGPAAAVAAPARARRAPPARTSSPCGRPSRRSCDGSPPARAAGVAARRGRWPCFPPPKAWTEHSGGDGAPRNRPGRGHGPVRTVDALRAGRLQRVGHPQANRQTYVVLVLPPLVCTTGLFGGAAWSPDSSTGQRTRERVASLAIRASAAG